MKRRVIEKGQHLPKIGKRFIHFSIFISFVAIMTSGSNADIIKGKVTSVQGNIMELNLGSDKGVKLGDSGKVYYTITLEGKERPIYVAKFKITHLLGDSSIARVEEKTGEVKVGYGVEMTVMIKLGELEVRSEPSGAKVLVDGKEEGGTPLVVSGLKPGKHSVKVLKEGYDPYESSETIGSDRKKIQVNLKKVVKEGELVVRTEPPGAMIYLDGRSVGKSPYEGKGLTPKKYKIRVSLEGFEVWESEEAVESGKRGEVLAQLRVKLGGLEVRSEPSGARVFVDGKEMGKTTLVLSDMKLGQYLVQVLHEGCEPYEEQVEITGVDRKKVVVNLKRVVREGELVVRTEPSGAMIYLDGKSVGKGSYDGKGLSPKSYRIKVTQDGYEVWERDIGVEVGKRVEVLAILKEKKREVVTSPPTPPPTAKSTPIEPVKREEVVALPKAPPKIDLRQGKVEVPSWNIGDKWIYRDDAGSTWTNEVMDIKEDLYIVKNERERDLYGYDKKTLNLKFIIEGSGRRVRSTNDFKQLLNFPMFVGKKWSETVTQKIPHATMGLEGNFINEFVIKGVEDVNTLAGKFTVFKIYWKKTLLNYREPGWSNINNGWANVWYSPEVKAVVKEEYEKTVFWGDAKDKELISYKLK